MCMFLLKNLARKELTLHVLIFFSRNTMFVKRVPGTTSDIRTKKNKKTNNDNILVPTNPRGSHRGRLIELDFLAD